MLEINKEKLKNCLQELGIQSGDGLLVHSAIQFLGKPVGGIRIYQDTLLELIGPHGTLAVPTFNFSFEIGRAHV